MDPKLAQMPSQTSDDLPAFTAGERVYDLNRVFQAVDFRGELEPLRTLWQASIWRAAQAEEQGLEIDDARLEGLAEEFRYAHDLVSAEECEQWLAARGLSVDDFSAFCVCKYWSQPDCAAAIRPAAPPDEISALETDARQLRTCLILSDEFPSLARALAWRVALACENHLATDNPAVARWREHFLSAHALTEKDLPDWIAQWGGAMEWFQELAALEAQFAEESQRLLTLNQQQRALEPLRLHLLRLELEILEFQSPAASREAYLCAREERLTLAQLAEQIDIPPRLATCYLEEVPEAWQTPLLSASPGEVLPAFNSEQGFQVCRLVSKTNPSLADPVVLARVNAAILRARFMDLEARHVRWHLNLEVEP